MGETGKRPIRTTGWAFRFFRFHSSHIPSIQQVARGRFTFVLLSLLSLAITLSDRQRLAAGAGGEPSEHYHHAIESSLPAWEGSPQGIAYSEFNHHLAGAFLFLIGLSEFRQAFGLSFFPWARFLLPAAMLGTAIFLLIWSDHEAWPIGRLAFIETFLGDDVEILQHKAYGLLSLGVGTIELLRRLGRIGRRRWSIPLPLFAIIGGVMLFGHMHGDHPGAHKIQLHHTVMGILAITAGSSKFVSGWRTARGLTGRKPDGNAVFAWEVVWAALIFLISIQLLFYSE